MRLPSSRADELSGVTGVATPFIVVYEEHFDDCDAIEAFVHTKLAESGLRVSDSREFFRAPVSDVIKVILAAGTKSQPTACGTTGVDDLITPDDNAFAGFRLDERSSSNPWDALMEEADKHYYGLDGYIQDYAEAFALYHNAARLGSPLACQHLGDIYRRGEGLCIDSQRALEYYKEGARKKNYLCYAEMTKIFLENDHAENARKSFDKFVKGGESDAWKQGYFPDHHIALMISVLSAVFRLPIDNGPFILTVRAYVPQLLASIQKVVDDPQRARASNRIMINIAVKLRSLA